ncbi:MAG: hypothetical protein FWH55_14370, partial [Oscillospiraceae bacterium]|nr:hypothetical protein [Oscillospiraceae bacterium]
MTDDIIQFDPGNELDEWITPTPLSDPVLTAIFQNYENDPGFAQFVQRHSAVASMPDIRKAYRRWEYD